MTIDATAALRELLDRYTLAREPLHPVANDACRVWRFGDKALRIYPPGTEQHSIAAEMSWLQALQAQARVCVPRPIAARDGSVIQALHSAAVAEPSYAVVVSWVEGRFFDRGLTALRLSRLGAAVATLHDVSQALGHAGRIHTRREAVDLDAARWQALRPNANNRLREDDLRLIRQSVQHLAPRLAALPRTASNFGLVHADLHPWNYLFAAGSVGIIDFSDCGLGHHADDIAKALFYLRHPWVRNHDHRPAYPALEAAFLGGYASVRPLPDGLAQAMPLFTAAKVISLLAWVLLDWPHVEQRAWGPACVRWALAWLATEQNDARLR